jgi:autonomous glycyl radical cofactor
MITGIQITKAANDDLLNSFWLLDSEKGEARCVCAKAGYSEDEVVAVSKLGDIEYREIPMEVKPEACGRRSASQRKRAASRNAS